MIIDRKNNISKLSQGEFIAAEMIENNHLQCPLIAQSFTYGDPTATYVVAVIVPDEDEARAWAAQRNLADKSIAELCDLAEFKFAVLQQIVVWPQAFTVGAVAAFLTYRLCARCVALGTRLLRWTARL